MCYDLLKNECVKYKQNAKKQKSDGMNYKEKKGTEVGYQSSKRWNGNR